MSMSQFAKLKEFGMTIQMLEHDLDRVEIEYSIALARNHQSSSSDDIDYYPQIEQQFRIEAAQMAPHYETFYSLEKSIRRLLGDTLTAAEGSGWWQSTRVPTVVKSNAETLHKKEKDSGTSLRSDDLLDFCTFGELGEVIKKNWDVFGGMFSSVGAVEKVMARLNSLRGPIAHCSLLREDEVLRLRLTVRDWFRLMD